jgi:hypothetical protein
MSESIQVRRLLGSRCRLDGGDGREALGQKGHVEKDGREEINVGDRHAGETGDWT